jgi:hypothetical protein
MKTFCIMLAAILSVSAVVTYELYLLKGAI